MFKFFFSSMDILIDRHFCDCLSHALSLLVNFKIVVWFILHCFQVFYQYICCLLTIIVLTRISILWSWIKKIKFLYFQSFIIDKFNLDNMCFLVLINEFVWLGYTYFFMLPRPILPILNTRWITRWTNWHLYVIESKSRKISLMRVNIDE